MLLSLARGSSSHPRSYPPIARSRPGLSRLKSAKCSHARLLSSGIGLVFDTVERGQRAVQLACILLFVQQKPLAATTPWYASNALLPLNHNPMTGVMLVRKP